MSVLGEGFGFSDIFNESQDIQYLDGIIQGTANEIIVTQSAKSLILSAPQRLDTLAPFQCNSLQAHSLVGPKIATIDASGNLGTGNSGIANSMISTDASGNLQGTTLSAVGGNGINHTLAYANGVFTSTAQAQQNLATNGLPSFAGLTLTGNLNMGVNNIATVGQITSQGNFTNGTYSMTTGALACSSANISGLTGPNILSIDAKGNITTADVSVDNALLGGDANGNIAGVTISNTSSNGNNSTLAYNGATRTLTLTANMTQNLSTSGAPQFVRETLQGGGGSGSSLSITCGTGGVNGVIVSDPSTVGAILISGGSGTTTYEVAMGAYNPGGAGSGFAIGTNAAGSFPQMYMFNKTADGTPTIYLQDVSGNLIYSFSKDSVSIPGVVNFTNTTNATAFNNGAVILSGGLGASGNLISNNTILCSGTADATDASGGTGALRTAGGLSVVKTIYGKDLNVTDTTDSTSTSTGTIICSGGIGVAKKIYCGSGINFGNDTLSVYKKGTWTPGLSSNGNTAGISYSSQGGDYRRIGDQVFVDFFLETKSALAVAGNILLTGLPYNYNGAQPGTGWAAGWVGGPANSTIVYAGIGSTKTFNVNYAQPDGAYSNLTQASMNTSVILSGQFYYFTNDAA